MPYAVIADLKARNDLAILGQLTGSPRGELINEDALQVSIDDAIGEVDCFLATRFDLPLTEIPQGLKVIVCDIAIYRLHSMRPQGAVEEARNRYKDALKRLEAISTRKASVGPVPPSHSVRIHGTAPVFSDEVMRRFGGTLLAGELNR